MRAYGITYDTGFPSRGSTTHEPFDPEAVRREMRIIRDELHCDAVRVTGGDLDRLETAARHAARAGLEVWYCPFTNGLTRQELLAFIVESATRAETVRREGARVVFATGSEISLFTDGFLPGATLDERQALLGDPARLRAAIPVLRAGVNEFLAEAVTAVRARFEGPVTYASLPFEGVDWTPFDIAATDAGYRDATNAPAFRQTLQALIGQGRPFAATEFGCAAFRGAADLGARSDDVLEYDERGRPVRLTEPIVRDEEEQARYIRELLDVHDEEGTDTAFVYTFTTRHLPTSADPERDFDAAGRGIVKVLEPGRTSTTHPGLPWEPKAAFRTLAEYGRARASR